MSKRLQITWFWAAVVVVIAAAVVGTLVHAGGVGPAQANASSGHYAVAVDIGHCGVGWGETDAAGNAAGAAAADAGVAVAWAKVAGGTQRFTISNGDNAAEDVQLENVDTKQIYLDIEAIGPGAKVPAQVVLAKGRYRFVCFPQDEPTVIGATVDVGAAPKGSKPTPGVQPLTRADLELVAKAYGDWIDGQLPTLQQQARALDADAQAGELAQAKTDWLAAHETYETLGAAYDAFGDHDAAINGTPASGQTAFSDPDLTGFHKIEALLWSGAPAPQVAAMTAQLVSDVDALVAAPGTDRIDPLLIGLRSHEIVENAIQFELTSETDAGSHTNLATIDANLSGAAEALSFLKDDLANRYPRLPDAEAALASTQKLVESYHQADGSWTPLGALDRTQREQLNAAMSGTAELLSPVAEIAEPRRSAEQ